MRKLTGQRLVIASHNKGKLSEISALLAPFGVSCIGAGELGLPVPAETETSFEGNALIKARFASELTGLTAISDDSGLEIDALGGAPGVYSADWAELPGGRDFGLAMGRVHAELLQSGRPPPWTARFRCVLAVAWADGASETFHGVCNGEVVWPMRGAAGHGYDPIFLPEGGTMTFAEMGAASKNLLSHRSVAFAQLVESCFT